MNSPAEGMRGGADATKAADLLQWVVLHAPPSRRART